MRPLKAGGSDLLVAKCFHWLPFAAVVHVWRLFDGLFRDIFAATPRSWNVVPHIGLAKVPGADRLEEHRWSANLSALFRC